MAKSLQDYGKAFEKRTATNIVSTQPAQAQSTSRAQARTQQRDAFDARVRQSYAERAKESELAARQSSARQKYAERRLDEVNNRIAELESTLSGRGVVRYYGDKEASARAELGTLYEEREARGQASFWERVGSAGRGAVEQYGGSMLNTLATASNVKSKELAIQHAADQYVRLGTPLPDSNELLNGSNPAVEDLFKKADELTGAGGKNISRAKAGLGAVGEFAVDAGVGVGQFGLDAIIGALTGGGMVPLLTRSFGGRSQEARQSGASELEQIAYGSASALLSALTSKISNIGAMKNVYGPGTIDDALTGAINKAADFLGRTPQGAEAWNKLLTMGAGALGEGFEEGLEAALDPALKRMTYDPNAKADLSEILYEALVGAAVGGITGLGGNPDINAQTGAETRAAAQAQTDPVGVAVDALLGKGLPQKPSMFDAFLEAAGIKKKNPHAVVNSESAFTPDPYVQNEQQQGSSDVTIASDPDIVNSRGLSDDYHSPQQQEIITLYNQSADGGLIDFVDKIKSLKDPNYRNRIKYTISEVSERAVNDVRDLLGVDVSGYEHVMTGDAVSHIENRHGADGIHDRSMANIEDLARIGYVLDNYDSANLLYGKSGDVLSSAKWMNSDNTKAPLIQFQKRINGTYYVVEAVPVNKSKQMAIVSAYLTKANGSTDPVLNMPLNDPQLTSEMPQGANASANNSIPQSPDSVNSGIEGRVWTEESARQYIDDRYTELFARINELQNSGTPQDEIQRIYDSENTRLQNEMARIQSVIRQQSGQASRGVGTEQNHIDARTRESVASRNVKAFQFDHPELHPYFVEAAAAMKQQLASTVRGERGAAYNDNSETGGYKYWGTSRQTSSNIAALLDNAKLTYAQISKALDDLIADNGQENYAAAKKVELALDDMLSEGYVIDGVFVPPNEDYIFHKKTIQGGEHDYRMSEDEWNSLMAGDGTSLPSGTGAAEYGFDPYSNLQNQTSEFHAAGEKATRTVDMPTHDAEGRRTSKTPATVMEAEATPDGAVPHIEAAVVEGEFSYVPITDDDASRRAETQIKHKGWDAALRDWTAEVRGGKVSKDLVATGWHLYNNAVNAKQYQAAVDILVDLTKAVRSGAQSVQAVRMLKKLSPQYKLYAVQRSVSNMQDELISKYGDRAPDLSIPDALVKAFLDAKDDTTRADAETAIHKHIAEQVPSTFADKWNAWRYLSMLGNLRTHVRNIVGNAGFMPVRMAKNIVATGIEAGTNKVLQMRGKDGIRRTKSLLNRLSAADRELISAAKADYANIQDQLLNNGKYNDFSTKIDEYRTIFKNNGTWGTTADSGKAVRGARKAADMLMSGLEFARKGNTKALDAEDVFFARSVYAESLASYLKANGVTAEQFKQGKGISLLSRSLADDARAYAIKEAQKATYRDSNDFSDWVSTIGRNYSGNSKSAKAVNFLVEGVLPFKRTPANILVRGVEYSPAGLTKAIVADARKVSSGDIDASQMIDNLSAGLVGIGLVGLGAFLAAQGLVTGGSFGDDKDDALADLAGHQKHALEIGGKSFTLDWLAPEALPFFVGVELYNTIAVSQDGKFDFKAFGESLKTITEPMLEMSMLSSLNDILESVEYSDSKLMSILATATTNHLTQAFPTILGQLERGFDKERQAIYIDKNSQLSRDTQYGLGKTLNKLLGLDYNQQPYIDAYGRTEDSGSIFSNMLNPSYTSTVNETDVDREVQRLYGLGVLGKIPQRPSSYFSYSGERIDMSGDEYTAFSRTQGRLTYELISDALDSDAYAALDDEQKADALTDIMEYANDSAKRELITSRGGDFSSKWDKGYALPEDSKAVTEPQPTRAPTTGPRNGGLPIGSPAAAETRVAEAIAALQPYPGSTDVSDVQEAQAITGANLGADATLALLGTYLSDTNQRKTRIVADRGYSLNSFVEYWAAVDEIDRSLELSNSGTAGRYSHAEVEAVLSRLDLSDAEKALFWALSGSNWAARNNPYGWLGSADAFAG